MFTGIVEEIGKVKDFSISSDNAKLTILANKVIQDTKLGDSIATNGICLTVVDIGSNYFTVDVMGETFRRTNLGNLKKGQEVNLERALSLTSRLGGHIVSGHIDGIGEIQSMKKDKNAIWVTIKAESDILKYVVEKGSIAIDGISLTVAYVDKYSFKVSIIPHTNKETTLISKKCGEYVNLECDIIAKYVEKLMNKEPKKESSISKSFLEMNGYL